MCDCNKNRTEKRIYLSDYHIGLLIGLLQNQHDMRITQYVRKISGLAWNDYRPCEDLIIENDNYVIVLWLSLDEMTYWESRDRNRIDIVPLCK